MVGVGVGGAVQLSSDCRGKGSGTTFEWQVGGEMEDIYGSPMELSCWSTRLAPSPCQQLDHRSCSMIGNRLRVVDVSPVSITRYWYDK